VSKSPRKRKIEAVFAEAAVSVSLALTLAVRLSENKQDDDITFVMHVSAKESLREHAISFVLLADMFGSLDLLLGIVSQDPEIPVNRHLHLSNELHELYKLGQGYIDEIEKANEARNER